MNSIHPTPGRFRRLPFLLGAGLVVICLIFGGASRADIIGHIPLRLASIGILIFCLMTPAAESSRPVRMPVVCGLAVAGIMALQLVPLPPEIWASLPGHELYAAVAAETSTGDAWRPTTLTPDLTINSLLALLPALAALILMGRMSEEDRLAMVTVVLLAALASAVLGILQLAAGGSGALYLYRVTNEGFPVGFFSNRNHQALLLAAAIPMLILWFATVKPKIQTATSRVWMKSIGAMYFFAVILIAGSRAGLVFAVLGMLLGWLANRSILLRWGSGEAKNWTSLKLVAGIVVLGFLATIFYMSRGAAFERIFSVDVTEDSRFYYFDTMAQMFGDFFPVGSGFGSFETVFRAREPVEWLTTEYFNHGHNDLLEIAIEGGLPALCVVAVLAIWVVVQSVRAWLRPDPSGERLLARLGSILILMFGGSSLVDYPLRTPFLAVLFSIALAWLGQGGHRRAASKYGPNRRAPAEAAKDVMPS